MLLGNLIPRVCTQLQFVSQTGKSVGTGEPKPGGEREVAGLARIFHESLAATTDLAVLPGVLGCRTLRRTVQVRLGTNPAVPRDGCQVARLFNSRSLRSAQSRKRVPSFVVSRQQFMKYPG